jgi:uncharacterized protein YjiS (DUF1127 family)
MASMSRVEFLRVSGTGGRSRQTDRRPTRFSELLRVWQARRRYRSELRRLAGTGTHLILDIGLLPAHAARETQKPFWQS